MTMELVDRPMMFPEACVCGRGPESGPFVDTGVEDVSGARDRRLYLCRFCVAEIAKAVELAPLAEFVQVTAQLRQVEQREAGRDEQVLAAEKERDQAVARIGALEDELRSAGVHAEIRERRIAALEADPAVVSRQQLLAELREIGSGGVPQLTPGQRRQRVAALHEEGRSQRAIAEAVGVSKRTIAKDLTGLGTGTQSPERVGTGTQGS